LCRELRSEEIYRRLQLQKYTFLPGINDNTEDVRGIIRICISYCIDFITISYGLNLKLEEASEDTLRMMI